VVRHGLRGARYADPRIGRVTHGTYFTDAAKADAAHDVP